MTAAEKFRDGQLLVKKGCESINCLADIITLLLDLVDSHNIF